MLMRVWWASVMSMCNELVKMLEETLENQASKMLVSWSLDSSNMSG